MAFAATSPLIWLVGLNWKFWLRLNASEPLNHFCCAHCIRCRHTSLYIGLCLYRKVIPRAPHFGSICRRLYRPGHRCLYLFRRPCHDTSIRHYSQWWLQRFKSWPLFLAHGFLSFLFFECFIQGYFPEDLAHLTTFFRGRAHGGYLGSSFSVRIFSPQ